MAMTVLQTRIPFLDPAEVATDPRKRPRITQEYLEECLQAIEIPPAVTPIADLSLHIENARESDESYKKRKLEHADPASPKASAKSPAPSAPTPSAAPSADSIEKPFDRDQLIVMNKEALKRGRAQKHAGDAHRRSPSSKDRLLGILELADALLVYVYAFWCDDHLRGRRVNGISKPACEKTNWQSTFGMLKFTRTIAVEAGTPWQAIVGLTNLLEGLILEHLTVYTRRQLHNRIDTLQRPRDQAPNEGHTPGSAEASSPPAAGATLHNFEEQIQAFMKLSIDIETKMRCLNLALYARDAPFGTPAFAALLPKTFRRAVASVTTLAAQVDLRGGDRGRWTWPLDLTNGPNALAHAAAFGRTVLEEIAEQNNFVGWRGSVIEVPSNV